MKYDEEKLDKAALVMLLLNYDSRYGRCWKSISWEITDRLFEAELITDPKTKNKSIHFTELGLKKAKEALINDFNGEM